jgi:hypothetical protein
MSNLLTFKLLKKAFTIALFFFGSVLTGFGQNKPANESASNAESKFIQFYPNPATTVINFDFQHDYNNSYSLLVFNFMGKKVFEIKNALSHTSLYLENFYRGIYIFQLRDKNGAILESGKFQVIK